MIGERLEKHRIVDFLAGISYPLYVVHPVLGYALLSVLVSKGVPMILTVFVTTLVAIAVAWALSSSVEKFTHRLGQRWARAMSLTFSPNLSPPKR